MNDLEVIDYDLDLDLGCGSPAPRSLYRPASSVDWLKTAERELRILERPPRGSPLGGNFCAARTRTRGPEFGTLYNPSNFFSDLFV